MTFLNISGAAEIHTTPRENRIFIIREKYGKKTIESYGFLKYFGWSRNPYDSKNMGKEDFHSTGKAWENTNIPLL